MFYKHFHYNIFHKRETIGKKREESRVVHIISNTLSKYILIQPSSFYWNIYRWHCMSYISVRMRDVISWSNDAVKYVVYWSEHPETVNCLCTRRWDINNVFFCASESFLFSDDWLHYLTPDNTKWRRRNEEIPKRYKKYSKFRND